MLLSGPTFLNTVLLGGSPTEKIRAASAAGFDQIELWMQEVQASSVGHVGDALAATGTRLTDLQVLLDFDGAADPDRAGKREEAIALLDAAEQLQAGTILVPASTAVTCVGARVVSDLRWLCDQAAKRGLRVALEGMAWSRLHSTIPAIWDLIDRVHADNLDLVVDAFHLFAAGRGLDDLREIPIERIALVQLSNVDQPLAPGCLVDDARHRRVLPDQGIWPIRELVVALADKAYAGPVGLEVFNDSLKEQDAEHVAKLAMASLRSILR